MSSAMSGAAELSRIEYQKCAEAFVACMAGELKAFDIRFSSIRKKEFVFVFGESWPEVLRNTQFASMYAKDFEGYCNRGLVGEGNTKRPRYEWESDCNFRLDYPFQVRKADGLHFTGGKLGCYNSFGRIRGFDALRTYADGFRKAAFLASIAADSIRDSIEAEAESLRSREGVEMAS